MKAAEPQKLRSLPRVNGEVEAEAHFCPQSSCLFYHILYPPTITGFTARLEFGGKTSRGTALVTWQPGKGLGFLFQVAWYLLSHCALVAYIVCTASARQSTEDSLSELCLPSQHRISVLLDML